MSKELTPDQFELMKYIDNLIQEDNEKELMIEQEKAMVFGHEIIGYPEFYPKNMVARCIKE